MRLDELYPEVKGLPEPLNNGQGWKLNKDYLSYVYTCILNEHIVINDEEPASGPEGPMPSGRLRKPSPWMKERDGSWI